LLRKPSPGIALNEHHLGHGDIVYQQACKLGCEGIVSKRLGSLYRSGRSEHWVKVKNPAAPACGARPKKNGFRSDQTGYLNNIERVATAIGTIHLCRSSFPESLNSENQVLPIWLL
jgi:hypothetical protein